MGRSLSPFFCVVMVNETVYYQSNKSPECQTPSRIVINRRTFAKEVSKCGLIIDKWVPKFSIISRQACAVLVREKATKALRKCTEAISESKITGYVS